MWWLSDQDQDLRKLAPAPGLAVPSGVDTREYSTESLILSPRGSIMWNVLEATDHCLPMYLAMYGDCHGKTQSPNTTANSFGMMETRTRGDSGQPAHISCTTPRPSVSIDDMSAGSHRCAGEAFSHCMAVCAWKLPNKEATILGLGIELSVLFQLVIQAHTVEKT
ncbi:hypothetical protein BT67DRAFT_42924 [Trichocladium antarcticum]|uniref:Uncharacterized protein n=1 Tax=Trichocladium antarcticum TaxID=1450529 RepID=A0AAN6UJ10_9PEZI|nr:hypothetical protein BT67DRAFT_42924 [Trichocladium antarcticum]